mgnify:CR=1 FL=1
MTEKNIIEQLAVMINNGFENQMKHLDERFGKIDERFNRVDERLNNLDARVGRIEADIHELRGEIVYRHEFKDALGRIKYLEKKLNIKSGV